jgi:hypothetical protein
MKLKDKALLIIDTVSQDDEVTTMILHPRRKVDTSSLIKKFNLIYECAHVAIGTCDNPHKEWVKNVESTYKAMHKDGAF